MRPNADEAPQVKLITHVEGRTKSREIQRRFSADGAGVRFAPSQVGELGRIGGDRDDCCLAEQWLQTTQIKLATARKVAVKPDSPRNIPCFPINFMMHNAPRNSAAEQTRQIPPGLIS